MGRRRRTGGSTAGLRSGSIELSIALRSESGNASASGETQATADRFVFRYLQSGTAGAVAPGRKEPEMRFIPVLVLCAACSTSHGEPRVKKLAADAATPPHAAVPSVPEAEPVAAARPDAGPVAVAPEAAPEEPVVADVAAPLPATYDERMALARKHVKEGKPYEALAALAGAADLRPASEKPHIEM